MTRRSGQARHRARDADHLLRPQEGRRQPGHHRHHRALHRPVRHRHRHHQRVPRHGPVRLGRHRRRLRPVSPRRSSPRRSASSSPSRRRGCSTTSPTGSSASRWRCRTRPRSSSTSSSRSRRTQSVRQQDAAVRRSPGAEDTRWPTHTGGRRRLQRAERDQRHPAGRRLSRAADHLHGGHAHAAGGRRRALPETDDPEKMPEGGSSSTSRSRPTAASTSASTGCPNESLLRGARATSTTRRPTRRSCIKADKRLKYKEVREVMQLVNEAGFPGPASMTHEAGQSERRG